MGRPLAEINRTGVEVLAISMREDGAMLPEILAAAGLTEGAARYLFRRTGIAGPRSRITQPKQVFQRGGRVVRPFTQEDALLMESSLAGLTYKSIGQTLGRRPQSVSAPS